jgi:hypothetical protein
MLEYVSERIKSDSEDMHDMENCRVIGLLYGLGVTAMSKAMDLPHWDELPKALWRYRLEWKIPDVDIATIQGRFRVVEQERRNIGLKMFAEKQRALMEGGAVLMGTSKDLQMALDVAASVAGSRVDASGIRKILAKKQSPSSFDTAVTEAQTDTALGGFRSQWVDGPVD